MSLIRTGSYMDYGNFSGPAVEFKFSGEPEYVGKCIKFNNVVERVMSDVWETVTYLVVWDCSDSDNLLSGRPKSFWVSCSGFDRSYNVTGTVDATPEVLQAYEAWQAGQKLGEAFARSENYYDQKNDDIIAARKNPAVIGRTVRVARGRKVPVGTEGLVFWVGMDSYNNQKVGIATTLREDARGRFVDVVWTAAKNCEVIKKDMKDATKLAA